MDQIDQQIQVNGSNRSTDTSKWINRYKEMDQIDQHIQVNGSNRSTDTSKWIK